METLKVKFTVHAPAEALWRALADFSRPHRFSPALRDTRLLTPLVPRIGAKRRSEFYSGGYLVEEITEWRENESLTTEWIESPFPVDWAQWAVSIKGEAGQASTVTVELAYQPRHGLLGRLLDRLVWRHRYARSFRTMIRGLEYYVITGEPIGEHGVPIGSPQAFSVVSEL